VKDLEPWGLFTGVMLSQSGKTDLRVYKNSEEFWNLASKELQKFLDIYEYSKINIEKWFSRYLYIFVFEICLNILQVNWNNEKFTINIS